MDAPRCTRCGQVQTPESTFCFRCGNRLFEGTPAESPRPGRTEPLQPELGEASTPEEPAQEPQPAPQRPEVVEVTVPDWLVQDWSVPIVVAVSATLFGLFANYLLEIFVVLAAVVSDGPVPWDEIVGQPIVLWTGFHGSIRGFTLSITGFAWIVLAAVVGVRMARELVPASFARGAGDRGTVVARAVKAGLVTMVLIIALSQLAAAVLDPIDSGSFFVGGRAFFGSANVVGAIFIGFLAGAVAALFALARAGGLTLAAVAGLRFERAPALFGPAWAGARRVLLVGVVGMGLFFYAAQLIDLASADFGPEGRDVLALAIAFIPWILFWGLLDVGGIMLVNAMRFFISEQVLFTGKPGWVYLGVLIAVAAFFLGGVAAARARRPADGRAALEASMSPVLIITPVLFVASWFWASSEGGEIVGSAVLLPILWTVVLAGGGLYWLNQAGLSPGISVRTRSAATTAGTPPPATEAPMPAGHCSACGNPLTADARFCSRCGSPVTG